MAFSYMLAHQKAFSYMLAHHAG